MVDKVVKVDDLVSLLTKAKKQIQLDSKNLLTEEDRRLKMSEAMVAGDAKAKILAAHNVMANTKLEAKLQGKSEFIDWLIATLQEKTN